MKNLIVGIDLNRNESQICYFERETQDAVAAAVKVGSARTTFPTKLSWIPDTGEWYYGLEADFFAEQKNGVPVDCLYDLCADGTSWSAEGREFSGGELLALFLERALTMLGVTDAEREITGIMITVPSLTRAFVGAIRDAYERLGIPRSRGYLQDYRESFYYHTLYQKPELWTKKVGLFHFSEEGVRFSSLEQNHATRPVTVTVKEGGYTALSGTGKEKDQQLLRFTEESLGSELYSSVFLMGAQFDPGWAVRTTQSLCRGQRKAFSGDNLFAKGACFAVREKVEERRLKGYLYLGNDLIRCNIGMDMKVNGAPVYYPLVTAGVNWYETGKECEFLLDGTEELIFQVSRMDSHQKQRFSMQLPGLPKRPAGTTRIRLSIAYESPTFVRIDAEDLGFGELFPTSGICWHETMEG